MLEKMEYPECCERGTRSRLIIENANDLTVSAAIRKQ